MSYSAGFFFEIILKLTGINVFFYHRRVTDGLEYVIIMENQVILTEYE